MLSIEVSLARPEGELLPAYNMLSYKVRRKCRGEGFLIGTLAPKRTTTPCAEATARPYTSTPPHRPQER